MALQAFQMSRALQGRDGTDVQARRLHLKVSGPRDAIATRHARNWPKIAQFLRSLHSLLRGSTTLREELPQLFSLPQNWGDFFDDEIAVANQCVCRGAHAFQKLPA